MIYTIIIIAITVLVSIGAFNNNNLYNELIFWPKRMNNPAEYHRFLSSGFIHANYMHLFFNMFTLYFFGELVESEFAAFGKHGLFLALYCGGIIVSSIPS